MSGVTDFLGVGGVLSRTTLGVGEKNKMKTKCVKNSEVVGVL